MSIQVKLNELKEVFHLITVHQKNKQTNKNENLIAPLLCSVYINVIYGMECYQSSLAVKMDQQDLHIFVTLKFFFFFFQNAFRPRKAMNIK